MALCACGGAQREADGGLVTDEDGAMDAGGGDAGSGDAGGGDAGGGDAGGGDAGGGDAGGTDAGVDGGADAGGTDAGIADAGVIDAGAITRIRFENFDAYSLPGTLGFGSQAGGSVAINTSTTENFGASAGSLKGTYPRQISNGGAVYMWGGANVWANTQAKNHIYVRFRARMPLATKHGCKFIKVFGYNPRDNAGGN